MGKGSFTFNARLIIFIGVILTEEDSELLAKSRPGSSPDEGIGTELLDQKGIRFILLIMLAFLSFFLFRLCVCNNGCCFSYIFFILLWHGGTYKKVWE